MIWIYWDTQKKSALAVPSRVREVPKLWTLSQVILVFLATPHISFVGRTRAKNNLNPFLGQFHKIVDCIQEYICAKIILASKFNNDL